MFMVNISCYGPHGRPIATAARATMLHYRSPLLRTLHTVAFAGLFLGGFAEQTQTLEVELCSRYREDPYLPTAGAVLQIQSKRVQFYGARLRVQARFSGIRYLLPHIPSQPRRPIRLHRSRSCRLRPPRARHGGAGREGRVQPPKRAVRNSAPCATE
ncbi:PREDICTED: seipin [Calidris pugnax]|uniref:seipin n=1 Tax=Calidris pugnax TaxID=198806 RepID=UPI00071C6C3D|nr:PREDICTED: seipin [Calidris pugnax]